MKHLRLPTHAALAPLAACDEAGAADGALAGGTAAAVDVTERRDAIVAECLRGRGHRVVG